MKRLIIIIMLLALVVNTSSFGDWFEDFESCRAYNEEELTNYADTPAIWWDGQAGVEWVRDSNWFHAYIPDPTATFETFYNSLLPGVAGNNTKMLVDDKGGDPFVGFHSWYHRVIGTYGSNEVIELTAEMAVASDGAQHKEWPLANHVVVGGVALGIAGNSITYGRVEHSGNPLIWGGEFGNTWIGSLISNFAATIAVNTWYEIRIIYGQVPGASNDKANLYYRVKGDTNWITVAKDYEAEADLGNMVSYLGANGPSNLYLGVLDNISLVIRESQCGDPGYVYGADTDRDCGIVDLSDFAVLAQGWLSCTDPEAPCLYEYSY
jgi:hypothetical protein